jgi:E1A/CREB-binding protein
MQAPQPLQHPAPGTVAGTGPKIAASSGIVHQFQPQQHNLPSNGQILPPATAASMPPAVLSSAAQQPASQPFTTVQPQPQQQYQQPSQQAPAQQPQQQQLLQSQGLNGGWQSDKDYEDRRTMITKIVHLLQLRKPNAPPDWLSKLPQMAKRLEESLYRSAKSFEEYNDSNTLKNRLQQLAFSIGMKNKNIQRLQQQRIQGQALQTQPQVQQAQYNGIPAQAVAQPLNQPTQQPMPPHVSQPSHAQAGQRMVNMSEINPIMSSQAPIAQAPAGPLPASRQQYAPMTQSAQFPVESGVVPGAAASSSDTANRTVSDRQQVLRHQQQRLLLLRHAAKCQHEDGKCPVTPHCAGMKRLWKHIAECKNQKCQVPHCVSSRYVLSHYHRCKDVRCPVCGPVREAIHRSHEKQKQMQTLKQSHQQAMQQTNVPGASSLDTATSMSSNSALPHPTSLPIPSASLSSTDPALKRQRTNGAHPAPSQQQMVRPLIQPSSITSSQQARPASDLMPMVNHEVDSTGHPVPSASGLAFSNGQVIMPKYSGPKPQEDHTLINCFSVEQIEAHIASLSQGLQLSPQKVKTKCLEVLKTLQSHQHAWVFNSPVDPVELGLPDYFEVIKNPMDLGTIRKKLENGVYHTLDDFKAHVHLTFDNAMLYNPDGSVVYNMAREMKAKFDEDFNKLLELLEAEEDIKRRNGEACLLCGCEKLLFEPPVFYCNGVNCPSKRIRRKGYYYVGGNNQYHWCHTCYQELRDNATIDLGDAQIKKESLTKKRNDEVHEESWVQCDRCERWVHQICALFNTRQNKDQRSEYACPRCTIDARKKAGDQLAKSSTPMAEDLPRTVLSEFLESHVRQKVEEYVEKSAKVKSEIEGMTIEEARKKLQMGGAISIRQVTSMERKLEVRERMKKRYEFKNYPEEFTFRCKCIVVFQNLDGVDVMLFGLYVYEHDESNPSPNKRAVYISYLDSVHYMRPRQMRTFIYHEILISYLDYVRRRGFATAHIWACPPLKGDDYILYAKPEDQKTPKDDRLRQWYIDMLVECQKRGIVGKLTNTYDLYFSDPKNDATVLPYMEGDYIPAEVENIIKDIEEGKSGKKNGSQSKKNKKAQEKKKSGRSGTRSSGLDDDVPKDGVTTPGTDKKTLQEGGRDYVMARLGETIHPMKESFIVSFLAWEGAREEDMVVPENIQEYRNANNITYRLEGQESMNLPTEKSLEATNAAALPAGEVVPGFSTEASLLDNGAHSVVSLQAPDSLDNSQVRDDIISAPSDLTYIPVDSAPEKAAIMNCDVTLLVGGEPNEAEGIKPPASVSSSVVESPLEAVSKPSQAINMAIREGKFAAMAARKRDRDGETKENGANEATYDKAKDDEKGTENEKDKRPSKSFFVKDSKGRDVKVLDDDEEELDCEFLNNRQLFLNLCQGNHYQFDQLRRAKHSSMMVLWHLHNRDAPKFVQQCATCSREILTGYRFHCPTCADFDQCQECFSNQKVVRHPHQLKAIAVASGQQNEMTNEQRRERQRNIQLHITLLLHASSCNDPKCPSANCAKMKGLMKHGGNCQIKSSGGCPVCKRIWALLQLHARQCKAVNCLVPNCMAIRERVRQLKNQQQAMDDRRRQEMNRAYRGKR